MIKNLDDYTATEVLQEMARQVKEVNVTNGWFDDSRTFGEDIALLHSEVSEMLEAYREWGDADMTQGPAVEYSNGYIMPKPEGIGSEAADILIRLLDTCDRYDINLYGEFARKLAYNRTRGYKHGGKKL